MRSRLASKHRKKTAYRFGLRAETLAAWYLRLKGYQILAERYRVMQGEIDVLARRGNTLVAVEVKARKRLSDCEHSISPHKQRKILHAVRHLLAGGRSKIAGLRDLSDPTIRFDAMWIVPYRWPTHIKDAWR